MSRAILGKDGTAHGCAGQRSSARLGPYLVKAPDNPEGVDPGVFEASRTPSGETARRRLLQFLKNFYN